MKYSVTIRLLLIPLLMLCLADNLPHGYYQFLRLTVCLGSLWMGIRELQKNRAFPGIVAIGLAILFNPIFKMIFSKDDWQGIDVLVAFYFSIWLIIDGIGYFIQKRKNTNFKYEKVRSEKETS